MGDQKVSGSRGSSPSLGALAVRRAEPPETDEPFSAPTRQPVRACGAGERPFQSRSPSQFPSTVPLLEELAAGAPPRPKSGTRVACIGDRSFDEGPKREALREITGRLADYDLRKEEHERWMRQALSSLDPVSRNNLIYKLFAPHYDRHMEIHERSIRFLLRQLVELERSAFPAGPLIGGNALEMSCGTGTVVKLVCEAVGPERASAMRFIANDISEDMKSVAREKLGSVLAAVEFTSEDISRPSFARDSFDTILLAQTVHLLTDPDVVAQERASNYMHIDSERHLEAKSGVISAAWDSLATGGLFVIIDEWPALLSDRGGPLGAGFAYLFNDGLRAVDLDILQSSVMQQLGGARFVAQLKVPIDSKHHMHLLAYRKEQARPNSRIPPSPVFNAFRQEASDRVAGAFRAIDPAFIEGMQPTDGSSPWVDLHPINDGELVVRPGMGVEAGLESARCIILDRCMHGLETYDRFDLVSDAVRSLAVGGSLIIIDEWNPPEGIPRPMRLDSLSASLMLKYRKNMVFAGSVRVPIHEGFSSGMYGFEYRKVI